MPSENNKRIAKNTLLLYARTLVIMFISLYTSRVILNVLGVGDFGIYNVVGGIVAMFSLINGSLTSATQRFLNFELGKKNTAKLKRIFSVSISIHAILALIVLIFGESIGLWFLNTRMNIALERMTAANWVYQCSLITFCVNLISIPYNATIIAHEKMNVFAYISILDALLQLIIVFLLPWILFDKLIIYAILMLFISVIIRIIYGQYCNKQFQECKFVFCKDKSLYKEMTSFAGWTFIGSSSAVLMRQGVNILINIFHGVTVNAARGIATQVEQAVNSFISNFMMAMNPPITKSYASGEHNYMKFGAERIQILILFATRIIITCNH
jgi:O-antigen/teichoic acid export membrane protein